MKFTHPRFHASAVLAVAVVLAACPARARNDVPALRSPQGNAAPRLAPHATSLNQYQSQRLGDFLARVPAAADDTLRVLALQVQFADSLMGGQPGSRRSAVRDSTWFANELQHMTDYFRGASRGHLTIRWTLDPRLYTAPKEMGYYGKDSVEETRVVELVQSLVDSADAANDFSRYDHVFVIHAGAGQETDIAGDSRVQLWSSFYDASDIDKAFPDSNVAGLATRDSLDGEPFFVDNFSIVPASASQDYVTIGTLGIWAFEVGNRLGLLPLFDNDPPTIPDSQGVGNFDLMAFGLFDANGFVPSFPCAFNRMIAGWLNPVTVTPSPQTRSIHLTDVNTGGAADTTCIKIPITESEYYLVVNRVHDANFDSLFTFTDRDSNLVPNNADSLGGAEFDFFLTDLTNPAVVRYDPRYGFPVVFRHTGSGIYIWHVDENVVRDMIAAGHLPDDYVNRKGVDLEEADGVQDLDTAGNPAFSLGSYYDSYRTGDGNQTVFGPGTDPGSASNDGVRTGIVVEATSPPAHVMTCNVRLESDYAETRTRWQASTVGQGPTVVNLDGTGDAEVVVAADSGRVYVFNKAGHEYNDVDADTTTIAPYFVGDGARWTGPPAFADLDGGGDIETVAASADGRLFAWKSTGAELADGDNNPATQGVLYDAGRPLVTPPMILDILGPDPTPEIVVVERDADSLEIALVDATGQRFVPNDPAFAPLWPVRVQGQYAAPLAVARTADRTGPAKLGVVMAWTDTLTASAHLGFFPIRNALGVILTNEPVATGWSARIALPPSATPATFLPSAPATGDIDGDGYDEIVLTTPDGRLLIYEGDAVDTGSTSPTVITLRDHSPSAPALGDVDGDGAEEIAVWDHTWYYLLETNGRLRTGWPKRIVPLSAGMQPPDTRTPGLSSPVIGDLDGDGKVDVLFIDPAGSARAFHADGTSVGGFPRVAPAGATAPPEVAALDAGAPRLLAVGRLPRIERFNTVRDSFTTVDEATLAIQTLPGTPGAMIWSGYRNGPLRQGRATPATAPLARGGAVDKSTFMIYPNPVGASVVHARVLLNAAATVTVHVYTMEGQEAVSGTYSANPGGLTGVPFDEAIDVGRLKSGVYFLRLEIHGDAGSTSLVKPFAVRR